tara:strand:- start:531 stop:2030 length:1500 start_codon:yes stop_codon:yes gene_type:complete
MQLNPKKVLQRVHGWKGRERNERIRRNRVFKQRYAKMLNNKSDEEFDSVNIGRKSKKGRNRRIPKGALPVWKTADPTFGAPSPQSIYCSIFLLIVSVCICLPELISALGHVNKSWFSSYISYGPQLAVLGNIVLTFWSICCYSRCCMTLAFVLTLCTIPFIAVQMGIVSIPAVMSFCCCFPDKCNGESHSINSAFHMNIHNPNGVGTKNGTTAEACDYLDNVPNQTQCARENGLLILYWTGVTLLLVSTSFLSASQYHWRLEKVWLNRAKEKIIESRFQDDSSSGSSNYGSSSSSGNDNYSDSDNEIGENGRKNYLKSKLKKTNKTRKHEKAKKKVSFSASTKRRHSISESSSDDDKMKKDSARMNAEERKEEVTRLLELAKVKSFNKKAKKNRRANQRPQSARVNSSNNGNQFNNNRNKNVGRSYTSRVSSSRNNNRAMPNSARQWSNRHDVGGHSNIDDHPQEEIGAKGSNQFASTRTNAHETLYTDDNGTHHRVNI